MLRVSDQLDVAKKYILHLGRITRRCFLFIRNHMRAITQGCLPLTAYLSKLGPIRSRNGVDFQNAGIKKNSADTGKQAYHDDSSSVMTILLRLVYGGRQVPEDLGNGRKAVA